MVGYIIISGGRSSRFGSDKAEINLDGESLLARHVEQLTGSELVVVGADTPGIPARFVREDPPFGGPVAALAAGIASLHPSVDTVGVIAVDMPYAVSVVKSLQGRRFEDAAIPTDSEGFPQPLCAIYRVAALKRALATLGPVEGKSMRELISHLKVAHIRLPENEQYQLVDIDTPADLEKVRDA